MTATATDMTIAALDRARDAVAHAVPVTPREHVQQVVALSFWLSDNAEAVGAEALDDLARKLAPLRKRGTR